MKTEQQARQEFAAYFLDLQDSMTREGEGAKVSKFWEWEFFIQHQIEEGHIPAEAITWQCPRSLESELNK